MEAIPSYLLGGCWLGPGSTEVTHSSLLRWRSFVLLIELISLTEISLKLGLEKWHRELTEDPCSGPITHTEAHSCL